MLLHKCLNIYIYIFDIAHFSVVTFYRLDYISQALSHQVVVIQSMEIYEYTSHYYKWNQLAFIER